MSNNKCIEELSPNKFAEFLMDYGKHISPQAAEEAPYDTELKSIVPEISKLFQSKDQGTILDIGCGNGIILNRFVKVLKTKDKYPTKCILI